MFNKFGQMEQAPEKKKKPKQIKSSKPIHDSSYGSMKTGTSSSSSLSLSLFSESDPAEAPSTSGCSSEMATAQQSKEKKERAKEFMKKLKSMLPQRERVGKMDTLSTLEQLVDSMRQLNENDKRNSEFKTPPPHSGSYQGANIDKLSQSNMYITVSPKNHVVQVASVALMEHLGYPQDWWKGRLLKDFLKKKDINTVNSCLAQHSTDDDCGDVPETMANTSNTSGSREGTKYFYARIRRFRKLGEGFNLQNVVSHCPFRLMITCRTAECSDSEEDGVGRYRRSLVLYCSPLVSAYTGGRLPEHCKFSLRHSLFCNYTYVDPNAVHLLGFLPQDLNGTQIFDLYHPEDLSMLLEIHRKIMLSMGQPFKSEVMRLRTRNGCYVPVETEWSSFINPWSMRLEFIIGVHTVLGPPSSPDLFEDVVNRPEKVLLSADAKKIQEKILEVLKKPIQNVFAEPSAVALPVKERGNKGNAQSASDAMETDAPVKPVTGSEKPKEELNTPESKSAVIDEKGISSIYNQLNYSHNIKRFLMSHPKSFSNLSDEDSVMTRDDSEDEAINEEEELPLEIPVVKPPSCGSSTQVHVSEQAQEEELMVGVHYQACPSPTSLLPQQAQPPPTLPLLPFPQVHVSEPGHGEEVAGGPPPFGDESINTNPPREMVPTQADSRHFLSEETLKKHTKLQERLYLQRISEEQPLLLNMRRVKKSRNTSHQKRPRPKESGDEQETAKHPCTNSGVFRSSSNIFMQNFPTVKENELAPATSEAETLFEQQDMISSSYLGQPFPHGPPVSMNLPVQQPNLRLVSGGKPVSLTCIPTSLTSLLPSQSLENIGAQAGAAARQNIQWPYYPQTGYTLLPQVMAGFYQPLMHVGRSDFQSGTSRPHQISQEAGAQGNVKPGEGKVVSYSDNNQSSVEDTTSSIMYLLEADSSTLEDSDHKNSLALPGGQPRWIHNKRALEPPWLRGVNWNTETRMRYTVPSVKLHSVLKVDDKLMKQAQQGEAAQLTLKELLGEISGQDMDLNAVDEEADYIFFPGDELVDDSDMSGDHSEEIELTQTQVMQNSCTGLGRVGEGEDEGSREGGQSDEMSTIRVTPAATATEVERQDRRDLSTSESSNNVEESSPPPSGEVVWTLEPCCGEEDNFDTPVNSSHSGHSEDEKASPGLQTNQDKKEESSEEGSKAEHTGDEGPDSGDMAMETVFGREAGTLEEKRGSSPKDGSLSGEMEDAQSSCSKESSSDLTPSEVRSNEEAGSSLKESDSSLKMVKGGPSGSVASPSSSNEHLGQEDTAASTRDGNAIADLEEIFQKLFVPLKIKVSHNSLQAASKDKENSDSRSRFKVGAGKPQQPHWLVEAHLSPRVALTYRVPSRQLEDVLVEDKRRLADLAQSPTVKYQLLQLLTEVDFKPGIVTTAASVSTTHMATVSPLTAPGSPTVTPSPSPSTPSPKTAGLDENMPLMMVSPVGEIAISRHHHHSFDASPSTGRADARTTNTSGSGSDGDDTTKTSFLSTDVEKKMVRVTDSCPGAHSRTNQTAMSVVSGEDSICVSMESLTDAQVEKVSCVEGQQVLRSSSQANLPCQDSFFSDTNSDPIADESTLPPSRSHSSATNGTTCDSTSEGKREKKELSRTDVHLQEKFQALESKCLGGQGIEDIIMSNVFFNTELGTGLSGASSDPKSNTGFVNILD